MVSGAHRPFAILGLLTALAGVGGCSSSSGLGPAKVDVDGADEPEGEPGAPSVPVPAANEIREGDVTLRTEADFAGLRGIKVVKGTVSVVRAEVTSLKGLEALEQVKSLLISDNDALTSLRGLEGLRRVSESLEIRENAVLADVDGLVLLESVGNLLQVGSLQRANADPKAKTFLGVTPEKANDKLRVVRLPNLTTVKTLALQRNVALETLEVPKLTELSGDLEIAYSPKLSNLTGVFAKLTKVGGTLRIGREQQDVEYRQTEGGPLLHVLVPAYGNATLTSVTFPMLLSAGGLEVSSNAALGELSLPAIWWLGGSVAIDNCAALSGLNIPKLQTLSGSLSLTRVGIHWMTTGLTAIKGDLRVASAPHLRELRGLEHLTSVDGTVHLLGNPTLVDLSALSRVTDVGGIDLDGNARLKSLAGLSSLAHVHGHLSLTGGAALTTMDAFAGLKQIDGDLVLWLDNLARAKFPLLVRVGGGVDIAAQRDLTEVSFPKVTSLGGFNTTSFADVTATFAFPLLKDIKGNLSVSYGPMSLLGLASLERIDGDVSILSRALTKGAMDAFVSQVEKRRGIGGAKQLMPAGG